MLRILSSFLELIYQNFWDDSNEMEGFGKKMFLHSYYWIVSHKVDGKKKYFCRFDVGSGAGPPTTQKQTHYINYINYINNTKHSNSPSFQPYCNRWKRTALHPLETIRLKKHTWHRLAVTEAPAKKLTVLPKLWNQPPIVHPMPKHPTLQRPLILQQHLNHPL